MARAPALEVEPTTDINLIRQQADEYRQLQGELKQKREATKETTGGKTAWRKACSESGIEPVILADAMSLVMKAETHPKKTTREWRIFIGYLRGLGFFDKLQPGLFDDFDEQIAASAASNAA